MSLLETMDTYYNNPEKSSATKYKHTKYKHKPTRYKHIAYSYSLFTQCSFDIYKNIYDYYRSKDCMKNFDQDLKEHVIKITNSNKKCYH